MTIATITSITDTNGTTIVSTGKDLWMKKSKWISLKCFHFPWLIDLKMRKISEGEGESGRQKNSDRNTGIVYMFCFSSIQCEIQDNHYLDCCVGGIESWIGFLFPKSSKHPSSWKKVKMINIDSSKFNLKSRLSIGLVFFRSPSMQWNLI